MAAFQDVEVRTLGSISISPPSLDFAASSGKRTAYEAMRISRGFFKVSCILVETYSDASDTSCDYVRLTAKRSRSQTHVQPLVFAWKEQMEPVV